MTLDITKPLQFECCDNAGTAFQIHDGKRQIAIVEVADPEGQPHYEDIDLSRAYAQLFTAAPDQAAALEALIDWLIEKEEGDPYKAGIKKGVAIGKVKAAMEKAGQDPTRFVNALLAAKAGAP